jgi:hypothetical protein
VAAHAASLAGVVAAVRALGGSLPSAAPLLALYTAALALQVSWPAMLLTARRPGYGFGHGLAALSAGVGAAAFAVGAVPAAGAALLPLVAGLSAGVFVSGALWRAAAARPVEPWMDAEAEAEAEAGEGGAAGAEAAQPSLVQAGVSAAVVAAPVVAAWRPRPAPPLRPRLGQPVLGRPRPVGGRGRLSPGVGGARAAGGRSLAFL